MSEQDGSAHEAFIGADGIMVSSEVDPEMVLASVNDSTSEISRLGSVTRALASWAEDVQGNSRHSRNRQQIFERDQYLTPTKIYDQMNTCYNALDDDVVANALDTTESLAFNRIRVQSEEFDEENVWNQVMGDVDLDNWIRQAWRELFTVSHYYGVKWWGIKSYKVTGKGEKRKRRKEMVVEAPSHLGFLDPTRVVPVNPDPFGNYKLAWIASDADMKLLEDDSGSSSAQNDDVVKELFVGQYKPSESEERQLTRQGITVDRLYLLNPENVWMHSLTKAPYDRWPRLRMRSIFSLLDLKNQLRAMDRAFLLSGTNFIVLVKKGTDAHPVRQTAEVDEVFAQVKTVSKSPVIVSDHRLSIEIITPDITHVLNNEKWSVIDSRLAMRLYGFFVPNPEAGRDDAMTLGRLVARGIASRRHMLKRDIEKQILKPIKERNDELLDAPAKIEFTPTRIELEMDEAIANITQQLRDRGDISRETVLNELGFDQDLEARRREREKEKYDKIFTPTNVPFASKDGATPDGSGRTGGRPPGSGDKEPRKEKEKK